MIAPDTRVAFNGVAEAARATGLKPHHLRLALVSGELRSRARLDQRMAKRDHHDSRLSFGAPYGMDRYVIKSIT